MLTFLGKRLLQLIPTLFFVSVIIFSLQQLLPGDPALVMAGEERDPEVIEQIRRQYHLDQPLPVQYVYWVKGVLSGDLGESMRIKQPVLSLIREKLPVTIQLASLAIIIALVIGVGAGIVSAVKKDSIWDYVANGFALWGISTPNFWLGIMLIFLFSVQLGWLPASGYVPISEDWRLSFASMIMPAFVLGNAIAAILMRHTRSAMLQVLESDYVRTARAKGLLERSVILKHVAFGRRADRADFHHSGIWQAHRRRGVQSRLCGGSGSRVGDGDDLHRPKSSGGYGLHPGQSAAARLSDG
jgi:peptide/nickel transport system permease protein